MSYANAVTRVTQARIAFGILGFERHVGADETCSTLDANTLRGDRDVGIAFAHDLAMGHEPHGGSVDASADMSHSTMTVPLNLASSAGVRSTMRVV